ncbi:MAG: glycosyltransferase [Candidatus Omnitrophica bacterium]|nr:glycosyltransferase [Candidatus Omnitrophota bacterium]
MKKIRVVHMVEDLGVGGIESVVGTMARKTDPSSFRADVWCIVKGGETAGKLRRDGINVRVLGIWTYHNPFNLVKLALMMRKERIDVLHTHGYFASTMGRAAGKMGGVRHFVTHLHTVLHDLNARNKFIDKLLNRFTDRIICVSEKVRGSFAGAGYDMRKAVTIYNGVDGGLFAGRTREGTWTITTVASLNTYKGHKYLLEAAEEVIRVFPDAVFQIVGDGPERGALLREASRLGISANVRFLGIRDDIPAILAGSSMFVLPSLREGLPVSIVEAMAASLPVVATGVGGVPEVVADGLTGRLVRPGDGRTLAAAIMELLGDREAMENMGKKGREIFERKFTSRIMMEGIEGIYREITRRGPPSPNYFDIIRLRRARGLRDREERRG